MFPARLSSRGSKKNDKNKIKKQKQRRQHKHERKRKHPRRGLAFYPAAQEAAACAGRCQLCDSGRLHGEEECELTKTLTTPQEVDPSTAWRRGIVDHRPPPPAVAAAAALLPLRSQSEVDRWTRETAAEAKAAMQELALTRKGLSRAPDPAMFHSVRVLKLSRNRIARLPEEMGDRMPCLERLEVRSFFFSPPCFSTSLRADANHSLFSFPLFLF